MNTILLKPQICAKALLIKTVLLTTLITTVLLATGSAKATNLAIILGTEPQTDEEQSGDDTYVPMQGGILEFFFTGTEINTGSFNFLKFGSVAGSFDRIFMPTSADYSFVVEFGDTSTNLLISKSSVSPVPEPATMLLFGTGLLGLAGINRRKNKSAEPKE